MKNEAELRSMKRGFATRRGWCALRFMRTKGTYHTRVASASYLPKAQEAVLFLFYLLNENITLKIIQ